jgi:hypothetical protein
MDVSLLRLVSYYCIRPSQVDPIHGEGKVMNVVGIIFLVAHGNNQQTPPQDTATARLRSLLAGILPPIIRHETGGLFHEWALPFFLRRDAQTR